jgi:hypothetical protein
MEKYADNATYVMRENAHILQHLFQYLLYQPWPTRGPRAACGPSTDSEKRYFGAKSIRFLEKKTNFGPQNGDFSKMWPSSRLGLAMAVLYHRLHMSHLKAKFAVYIDHKTFLFQKYLH